MAGNGAVKKQLPNITAILAANGFEFELVETTHRGHAIDLVQKGIEKGFRKIIAIGGDGTNNEVVNGILVQTQIPSQQITYCLLPVGTGNDWIKEYGIPKKVEPWIKMMEVNNTTLQDVGLVQYDQDGKRAQRYFANVAGMAYDPYVLSKMEQRGRPLNRLAYLFFGLYCVFKYNLQKARVYFNGKTIENYYYLINVGICRYSGGGMQLVPHAIPNDGKLALTLAGPLSKIGVILNSYRFYNGSIGAHSKVETFQSDHIKVEAVDTPIQVEVDGELLGQTPVEFSLIQNALKIIIP